MCIGGGLMTVRRLGYATLKSVNLLEKTGPEFVVLVIGRTHGRRAAVGHELMRGGGASQRSCQRQQQRYAGSAHGGHC